MSLAVVLAPEAGGQFAELIEWWTINRPAASTVLEDELARVLDILLEQPGLGRAYQCNGRYPVRHYPLRGTPYHVFYSVASEENELHVLAIWSMIRRHGPPLRML